MASIVQSSDTVGFADSQLYGETPAEINANLDLLQSTGSNTVRIPIPWAGVEPFKGVYDWTETDAIVKAAEARGMAIDADINSTPYWAATKYTPAISGPPASDAAYAAFASQVATRYAGQISSYEIWNEPNSAQFWSSGPNAAAYTALLKAAYPAIKAADPKALVVAGAVGSVIDFGNLTENPVEFISKVYADGGKGFFDALSFHPYSYSVEFSQGANVANSPLQQLEAIRQLMVNNGDASKLIWATEYGLETSLVSQQTQATYVSDFLKAWASLSYVGPQFVYTVEQTPASDTADPSDTYGVFNANGTVTAAEQAIAAFIAAHPLPTTPVTTPPVVTPPVVTAPAPTFISALAAFYQKLVQTYVNALMTALSHMFTPASTPVTTAASTTVKKAFVLASNTTTTPQTDVAATEGAVVGGLGAGGAAAGTSNNSGSGANTTYGGTSSSSPGAAISGGTSGTPGAIAAGSGSTAPSTPVTTPTKQPPTAAAALGQNLQAAAGGVGRNLQAAEGGLGRNVQSAAGGLGRNLRSIAGGLGRNLQAIARGTQANASKAASTNTNSESSKP